MNRSARSRWSDLGVHDGRNPHVDHATLFDDVRPESGFLPCRLTGRVRGDGADGAALAIAVNGTIRSVTRAYRSPSRGVVFAALLPEAAFEAGANTVEVFAVAANGNTALRRVHGGGDVRWSLAADGAALVASDGRTSPVAPGAVEGRLEEAVLTGDFVQLRGWAADVERGELAAALVVFVDGRFLSAGRSDQRKLDVGDRALERAGFLFTYPRDTVARLVAGGGLERAAVRVFAVSRRGEASEVGYPGGGGHASLRPLEAERRARRRILEEALGGVD